MKNLLYYLLQMIIASSILYCYYHLALRNKRFHLYNRFYLLAAVLISLLIPFVNIPVYFTSEETHSSFVLQTLTVISSPGFDETNALPIITNSIKENWFTWQNLSYSLYVLIAFVALLRILFSLLKIRSIIRSNPVEKLHNIRFVNTDEPGTPFSFFKWLFWNRKIELQSPKGEQVFRHELFHIEQKHSRDILFMELLTTVFWVNPFFHLLKKELKAIHEFLADEFAIKETEKWQYAELLLMQALNTQIHLTNPFFHNQIKRRVAMITSSSKPKYQYLRKLLVLPIAAIIVALFAFKYKERRSLPSESKDSLPTGKINITDTGKTLVSSYWEFWSSDGRFGFKADSVVFNSDFDNFYKDIKKDLFIVNNEKKNLKFFLDKKIIAKKVIVYPENNQKIIERFGPDAKNGVIVFENATIENLNNLNAKTDTSKPISKIYEKVEVAPTFPEGDIAWRRYLEKNLQNLNPAKNGCPKGNYTVYIQFIVDADGSISNVIPLTSQGYGMEEKAVEVIRKGPKWIPAMQNGKAVKAYKKQPITFVIIGKDNANEIIGKDNINSVSYPDINNDPIVEKEVVVVYDEADSENKVYVKVETEPSFPGGDMAWRRYLEKSLQGFNPSRNGTPKGAYTVYIQFVVDIDGSISDVIPLTKHGYGMEEKAMEVIKKGPKWVPAIQNGKNVKAYKKQPVTFEIIGKDKTNIIPYPTIKDKTNAEKEVVVVQPEVDNKEKKLNENTIFEKVEIEPSFPGGKEAWQRYLQKNLLDFNPADNGAPEGIDTVTVQFIVHTDGFISDIKPLTHAGYKMEEKVVELISKGPRWKPAIQNGHKVTAYKKQTVYFQIQSEFNDESLFPKDNTETSAKAQVQIPSSVNSSGNIYPNPSTYLINIPISTQVKGSAVVTILDMSGKAVLSSTANVNIGLNAIYVDTRSLKPGNYIVNVSCPDKSKRSYKMIKE